MKAVYFSIKVPISFKIPSNEDTKYFWKISNHEFFGEIGKNILITDDGYFFIESSVRKFLEKNPSKLQSFLDLESDDDDSMISLRGVYYTNNKGEISSVDLQRVEITTLQFLNTFMIILKVCKLL